MSGYKDILKRGWHPEKEGTTLKGQMKSLVGRGGDDQPRRDNHVAAPLSSLRDPGSFAPPPKRNPNAVGGVDSPAASPSPASQTDRTAPPRAAPDPGPEEPPAPPKPWRIDATGLSTAHLPPPPTRKDGAASRSSPAPSPTPPAPFATGSSKPVPPALPPRLPPRSSGSSPATLPPRPSSPALPTGPSAPSPVPAPPPSQQPAQSYLNQSAIDRLGAAGISVPGLGINPTPASTSAPSSCPAAPPAVRSPAGSLASAGSPGTATSPPQLTASVNELQSRFSQLKTPGAVAVAAAKKKLPPPPPPKKKPGLAGAGFSGSADGGQLQDRDDGPPPIPAATKPQF